ncbi:exocyst complex component EXO70H1-like [Primulina huaijiensis]|uniref:exocyst complex component EXO70H1-like n=1 Tax=Primulina huaijiensis TaxID=1492673 RepID=UPI003CC76525
MATKTVRTLLFSPKSFSSSSSNSPSSTLRYGFSPSRPSFHESVMERTLDMAEPFIMKWNTETPIVSGNVTSLFHGNRREARDFLKCVNNLHREMQFLNIENSSSERLTRAQNLMQTAMKRLQKEFYQILSTNRASLDPESVSARSSSSSSIASSLSDFEDSYSDDEIRAAEFSEVEDVAGLAMEDLRLIAECMISSGYVRECLKIYIIIRQSVVDEGIYRLGVEKFTPSQIHKMDREGLDMRINNWLNALKVSVKTLFNGERILCDHVFAISDSIRESCFAEIAKGGAMILFEFPENIAKKSKRSPEQIFRPLEMYAAISDHWAEIDSIFSSNPTASIKSQAMTSLIHLAEFVRSSFDDFESAISKDSSKPPISCAGIHSLTTQVLNHLSLLSDYSNVLADIFADSAKSSLPGFQVGFPNESPAVSQRVARLILALLCKLDAKAKQRKSANLANLFLAKNLQYVVEKVRSSNLKYLLGEEWLIKHDSMVKQFLPK